MSKEWDKELAEAVKEFCYKLYEKEEFKMKDSENNTVVCPKCGKSEKVMKQSVFLVVLALLSFFVACCMTVFIITLPGALLGLLFTAVITLMIPFSFKKYVCLDCGNTWKPKKPKVEMKKQKC